MMKKLDEQILNKELYTEVQLMILLEDAVYTERFISKPSNRKVPAMYKIIECSYDEQDYGYYIASYKGRATPRQLTRYNFAVEVMLMIKSDVDIDPVFARKLLWMKANRFPMTKLAKMFGYHRTTLKIKYQTILERLVKKINSTFSFDRLDKILYKY
jgi:hypothetical protein